MIGGRVEEGETPLEAAIFIYEDLLEGSLTTSEEIEAFLWYDGTAKVPLSNTLKNEVIPFCQEEKLIKEL